MTRMQSLFAVLVLAATLAAVPAANAQTVHYIGAGSSAMFQGFAIAAVNDLAKIVITAHPGYTVHHWSVKTASGLANLKDSRTPVGGSPPPLEAGNFWAVWVDDTAGTPTDVWAYLSVDSTVGVRGFLAAPQARLLLGSTVTTTPGTNGISNTLFNPPNVDEAALPNSVYLALSGPLGKEITAGMTDIRPEDALLATYRVLGKPGDTVPFINPPNWPIYSFALGYGPGPIGNPILSSQSSTKATPVAFALPGFLDPITNQPVSNTIKVFPIGESPIVFIANRTNPAGLGQTMALDGSYYARNVWDQHPWPATDQFPSLDFPTTGFCSIVANQGLPQCHVTRRPLGNLFSSGDCEGNSSAFTWPLDAATQGLRATIPNGINFPLTLVLREPLSGTYNTTEYSVIRPFGTQNGSDGPAGATTFERPPYISQESNVVITGAGTPPDNPLNKQCPAAFGESAAAAAATEGFRLRAIGTGEEVATVKAKQDSLGYAFFSFGNVSSIAATPAYGYLMIDGIDPLFADYKNAAGNPGQPASPGSPLTWGELPVCSEAVGSPLPHCTVAGIWGANPSYPHIRDGSYPAWSELRLICDTADFNCDADPLGAEALVQNLQADIHNNATGGVPDLLPFSDASSGALSFNPPFGDAGFVRQHYSYVKANDGALHDGLAPFPPTAKSTTHQANTLVNFSAETCGPNAKTGPTPADECGGDAGGFIVPAGSTATGNLY